MLRKHFISVSFISLSMVSIAAEVFQKNVLYCLVPTLVYFEVATWEKTMYRVNILNGTRQCRQVAVAALPQQTRMPGHGPQRFLGLMRGLLFVAVQAVRYKVHGSPALSQTTRRNWTIINYETMPQGLARIKNLWDMFPWKTSSLLKPWSLFAQIFWEVWTPVFGCNRWSNFSAGAIMQCSAGASRVSSHEGNHAYIYIYIIIYNYISIQNVVLCL